MFEKVKNKFEEDPVSLCVWVVLSILMIATLAGRLDWWTAKLSALVSSGTYLDNNKLLVKGWFSFLLAIIFTTIFVLLALLIRSEIARRKAIQSKSETSTIAHKTMMGMMRAATKIRHQLLPTNPGQSKSFALIENTYLIHNDFTVDVTRKYEIRAAQDPIHFWEIGMNVNSDAPPVDYLDGLDFKVTSSGGEIVYLPIENDGRAKRVVLYFLPRIEPGEANTRCVLISYKWPKMLAQMGRIGEEASGWVFESVDPVPKVRMSFFLEPGTKKNLECEISGTIYAGSTMEKATHGEWPGFIYEVSNVPAGRTQYGIRLRLREP
jgi:hypothetical protein